MKRQIVSSTDIQSVGYDQLMRVLEIEFHSGGVYHYSNVPNDVYNSLMCANSHGKYFHQNIKDVYACNKVL